MKKFKTILIILFLSLTIIYLPTYPKQELLNKVETELQNYSSEFTNAEYAIIVDYDKPIIKRRLWVIDLKSKKVLINSHVSHALKSGILFASRFSNESGSNISSRGTFKTLNKYESQHGKGEYKIGMRLKGLEKGINNNVLDRNIVFHCSYGFWSSGCFMTWPKVNKAIIELTKNGSIMIVH